MVVFFPLTPSTLHPPLPGILETIFFLIETLYNGFQAVLILKEFSRLVINLYNYFTIFHKILILTTRKNSHLENANHMSGSI